MRRNSSSLEEYFLLNSSSRSKSCCYGNLNKFQANYFYRKWIFGDPIFLLFLVAWGRRFLHRPNAFDLPWKSAFPPQTVSVLPPAGCACHRWSCPWFFVERFLPPLVYEDRPIWRPKAPRVPRCFSSNHPDVQPSTPTKELFVSFSTSAFQSSLIPLFHFESETGDSGNPYPPLIHPQLHPWPCGSCSWPIVLPVRPSSSHNPLLSLETLLPVSFWFSPQFCWLHLLSSSHLLLSLSASRIWWSLPTFPFRPEGEEFVLLEKNIFKSKSKSSNNIFLPEHFNFRSHYFSTLQDLQTLY